MYCNTLHSRRTSLAVKLVGVDAEGRRCWIWHDHTAVDERFDIDEHPVDVLVGHERLESCAPRVDDQPVVVVREEELGL